MHVHYMFAVIMLLYVLININALIQKCKNLFYSPYFFKKYQPLLMNIFIEMRRP